MQQSRPAPRCCECAQRHSGHAPGSWRYFRQYGQYRSSIPAQHVLTANFADGKRVPVSVSNGGSFNADKQAWSNRCTFSNSSSILGTGTLLFSVECACCGVPPAGSTFTLSNTNTPTTIINATGNLTLTSTWDLSKLRFGPNVNATPGSGEPGILTLRAAGNLDFNFASNTFASLSDGFGPAPTPTSTKGGLWQAPLLPAGSQSWSYNLVAGADLAASRFPVSRFKPGQARLHYLLLLGNGGSAPPSISGNDATTIEKYYQVIRTGTGDIGIFAGQDVQLLNQLAAIYTAGSTAPTLANFYLFPTPRMPTLPVP